MLCMRPCVCEDTSVAQSSTVYPSDKSSLTQDMAKSVPGEQTVTLSQENDFSSVLMDTSVVSTSRCITFSSGYRNNNLSEFICVIHIVYNRDGCTQSL